MTGSSPDSSLQKPDLTHPSDGFESGLGMAQKTRTFLQDSGLNALKSDAICISNKEQPSDPITLGI